MRYSRAERLIQLALEMQAARGGLTIADIMERFGVSRRTAIRMRDAVLRAFPDADDVTAGERAKRWRLPPGSAQLFTGAKADDLATLALAVETLEGQGLEAQAETLRQLGTKLRGQMTSGAQRTMEPDLEALLEAEGIAHRPGPRSPVAAQLLADLRDAIKSCRRVAFDYTSRTSGELGRRTAAPLGLLYGHRHYLVADEDDGIGIRYFTLPSVRNLQITNMSFVRDPDFRIDGLVSASFGVFREDPVDVCWRFQPRAAPLARTFCFHESQSMEDDADGGLTVRFRAGGMLEMAWYLMAWGDAVDVVAPATLKALMPPNLPTWPALP